MLYCSVIFVEKVSTKFDAVLPYQILFKGFLQNWTLYYSVNLCRKGLQTRINKLWTKDKKKTRQGQGGQGQGLRVRLQTIGDLRTREMRGGGAPPATLQAPIFGPS